MKVLFVTNMWPDPERPWYGGFVRSQAESLRELGIEVDTLAIRGYASRWAYLWAARAMAALPAGSYDIVHAHYGHSGLVGRIQLGAPLIVSYCGDDLLGTIGANGSATPQSIAQAAVFRQLARVCTATITKSEQMAARLPACRRGRNHVIPNGVDLERFRPVPREQARRLLGWTGSEPVVLFVGDPRLPVKNFALARAAVELARKRTPGVRLHVVWGHAPDDVPLIMNAGDALLVASRSEGSPNAVKEAMASELPIVSTPVGDVEERLRGVAGCQVRPAEAGSLADALVAALQRGRCPEARRAVKSVSVAAVARRVLGVYAAVLERHEAETGEREGTRTARSVRGV
jgi:glycosyltransferase involved in cell wall biosynthesis